MRLLPDHIYDHEDHLLFFVRDLIETKGGQVQLIVDLEHIFKRWQSVHNMPVINLRMFINLHSRRATTHFSYYDGYSKILKIYRLLFVVIIN